MGWGIGEDFLEELAWSTMGGNPRGKNSEGQAPVVGMSLEDSRGRSEASVAGAEQAKQKLGQKDTSGAHVDRGDGWRLRVGSLHALNHHSNQSQIQPQLTSNKAEGPVRKKELTVGQMRSTTPLGRPPRSQGRTWEEVFGNVAHSSTFILGWLWLLSPWEGGGEEEECGRTTHSSLSSSVLKLWLQATTWNIISLPNWSLER